MYTTVMDAFSDVLVPPTQEAIEQERRKQLEMVQDFRRRLLSNDQLHIPIFTKRLVS
jgi:hypothetical protein